MPFRFWSKIGKIWLRRNWSWQKSKKLKFINDFDFKKFEKFRLQRHSLKLKANENVPDLFDFKKKLKISISKKVKWKTLGKKNKFQKLEKFRFEEIKIRNNRKLHANIFGLIQFWQQNATFQFRKTDKFRLGKKSKNIDFEKV